MASTALGRSLEVYVSIEVDKTITPSSGAPLVQTLTTLPKLERLAKIYRHLVPRSINIEI